MDNSDVKAKSRKRKSQSENDGKYQKNTRNSKIQQTKVKPNKKRSQEMERDNEEKSVKRVRQTVQGQKVSEVEIKTNRAKKLKEPLTRARLKKQKGR